MHCELDVRLDYYNSILNKVEGKSPGTDRTLSMDSIIHAMSHTVR